MSSKLFIVLFLSVAVFKTTFQMQPTMAQEEKHLKKPNIIFVLADDLARGDIGAYGQTKIKTPVLDRIAKEGMRFTQGYSGASVCAPSRASLVTGLHTGHCPIRANREIKPEGQKPLPENTYTIGKLLKENGYATLCSGKWGMGMFDTSGSPLKMGFDHFYGYNCQRHAHSYFPTYLYENDKRVELDGKTYSQDIIIQNTLQWIREHKDKPFFLFYAATLPHGNYEIDDLGIYKDEKDWNDRQKTYAAMVTRLDTQVGQILDLLKELNLDEETILFFAGDNGSSFDPNSPISQLFNSQNGLRGYKRSLYEGGLRQAFLARWTKHITADTVNDTPIAFWDILPTVAELVGGKIPVGVPSDGVSILPALFKGQSLERDTFYWELHEGKSIQAARWKNWKFIKNDTKKPIELYDLQADPNESNDLASKHPDLIKTGENLLRTLRTESPDWQLKD
ncbi:MAG: arylsulfatase [Planctomycetaceae bacterium]|jgi:arylsulfatase A-like enzyme|nr:arylsulfatase [Planctomycetaceae bacterium]